MFLTSLNTSERKIFLELAHHTIAADGIFHTDQVEVYNSYEHECEMPDYEFKDTPIEDITKKLRVSTKKIKRIMVMELWGIVVADEEIHPKEAEFMLDLDEKLGFTEAQGRRMKRWALDLIDLIEDGYRIIEG